MVSGLKFTIEGEKLMEFLVSTGEGKALAFIKDESVLEAVKKLSTRQFFIRRYEKGRSITFFFLDHPHSGEIESFSLEELPTLPEISSCEDLLALLEKKSK